MKSIRWTFLFRFISGFWFKKIRFIRKLREYTSAKKSFSKLTLKQWCSSIPRTCTGIIKWIKIIKGIMLGFKHARIKLFVNCHFNVNYEVVHFNNKFTIICVLFFIQLYQLVYVHIHITLCACILPCNYLFITCNLLYKGFENSCNLITNWDNMTYHKLMKRTINFRMNGKLIFYCPSIMIYYRDVCR